MSHYRSICFSLLTSHFSLRTYFSLLTSHFSLRTYFSLLTYFLLLTSHFSLLTSARAQGLPRIRNYTSEEYGAHNRNFDIEIGRDGTVFVANFEGLLYYDRAQWHILHTPDISRITVVYADSNGTIWVGGYNFFARIQQLPNGELTMQRVGSRGLFSGEVMEIFERDGTLQFVVSDGNIYTVSGDNAVLKQHTNANIHIGVDSEVLSIDALLAGDKNATLEDIKQTLQLDDGIQVQVKNDFGLIVNDSLGRELYTFTEAEGLCSSQVAYVAYDGHGCLWGATSHGIFAIELPSAYTYLLPKDGLSGDVHAIETYAGKMYVGTSNGLFTLRGNTVERIDEANSICWALCHYLPRTSHANATSLPEGLIAATSSGMYLITANAPVRRLTTNSTTSVLVDGSRIYAAENNGIYIYEAKAGSQLLQGIKVCNLEQVVKLIKDSQGTIWCQSLNGQIWCHKNGESKFHPATQDEDSSHLVHTIVNDGGCVRTVGALDTIPFPYPAFATTDATGTTWLTDKDGDGIYQWKDGRRQNALDYLLNPISDMSIGALFRQGDQLWVGSDDVVAIVNTSFQQAETSSQVRFRSIIMQGDSVLWGGFGDMPQTLPDLHSDESHLHFYFALDYAPLTGTTLYRYHLNSDKWSAWTEKQDVDFLNLPYGSYTLYVQARRPDGELTEPVTVDFSIAYPLYMRWYMIVLYLLLFVIILIALFRYRLKRLQRDKDKLERIVEERTSEVVKQKDEIVRQKDEIEEKSRSLEQALNDLNNAQHELIRQEKMASVGKLTEGLIDRILNPMNYIINFSKMSNDLLQDLKGNIENNKDSMDPDDFADTEDVLDMLTQNLQSVDQYGQNTTRTLKAMEEMLKDRTGGFVDMDLLPVLHQNEQMLTNYYARECELYHISIHFNLPESPMTLHGNPEMLSKTIMSLLANAVYAVVKKAQKVNAAPQQPTAYAPEVSLSVTTPPDGQKGSFILRIRDNGIGIEEKILPKIFDPFFTTKTTDEASGVGLYLSREIIQNHKGDISVTSAKDKYTEFTITLPANSQQQPI